MITQFGELFTKAQDPVIFFLFREGETILHLHHRYLQDQCKMFIFKNKIRHKKYLTGKYITEIPRFKHINYNITIFELTYRNFEQCKNTPILHYIPLRSTTFD